MMPCVAGLRRLATRRPLRGQFRVSQVSQESSCHPQSVQQQLCSLWAAQCPPALFTRSTANVIFALGTRIVLRRQLSAQSCTHTPDESSCWNCGEVYALVEGKANKPMFCGKCDSIQPPAEKADLFELFGIVHRFDVDTKDLERRYKKMMAQLHPDRFMQKSEEEQRYSSAHSSTLNDGYRTLKSPHSRAAYMLKLQGVDFENSQSQAGGANMEFMMEVMEASSAIQEAGRNQETLAAIRTSFYLPHLAQTEAAASSAFAM
jgi:molecular chaperone HscB